MANRDAKLIERTLKDFSLGAMSGEGGTTVIANPELSGDEADLTGLQVGDTKYKVPQGGTYYRHVVYCEGTGVEGCFSGEFQLEIINTEPTEFNFTSLVDFLNTNGYTFEHPYPCQVDTNTDGLHLGTCRYQDNTVYTTMGGVDALYIDDQNKENLVDFVMPFFVVPVND